MKKRNLCRIFYYPALLVLMLCSMAQAQTNPGSTGSFTKCTYTPPASSGYEAASVWYPCNSGNAKLAATTLTSGYTGTYSAISYLADHLVTHGYIIFAMTPNNRYGNNASWTSAHKAGIAMLKSENTRTGTKTRPNPIRGKVDATRLQIMGHSKGGGGTLLAAADFGSGIKAAQAIEPYMDFSYNLSKTRAKINCITGTQDSIASPGQVIAMYNSLPDSVDRTLMYFLGMDHMVFTSTGNATQKARSSKYITAFMKYHLDGNSAYRTYLYGAEHKKDASWFYGYAHNMDF